MINGEHPYLSERDQEDILLNLIDEKQVLEIMKDKKIVFKQKCIFILNYNYESA